MFDGALVASNAFSGDSGVPGFAGEGKLDDPAVFEGPGVPLGFWVVAIVVVD